MKLNSLVTHGNYALEKYLRDVAAGDFGIVTQGNVYVVFNTSDAGYVQFAKDYNKTYEDGTELVQTSLETVIDSVVTTNRDDIVFINDQNTHTLTSMLAMDVSRTHLIGLGPKRKYGQGAKVSITATTGATNVGTVLDTGVRNSYHNIKFINNSTVTEGIYCFVDGGEYTLLDHCEVYKSTDMDATGAAELVANGDSSIYRNCTFGSLATARSGAVIRPNVLVTNATAAAGKVARDVTFENCNFWINASNTTNRFVYGANAADVERMMLFDNCVFFNNGASTAIPAQNVAFGASLTVGEVLIKDCSANLNAGTAMSTTTKVTVTGAVPTAATSGIAVQAA